MALVALPDPIAALLVRLRSFSEITALVTTAPGYTDSATTPQRARPRISPVAQSFWKLPTAAIMLRKAGGPAADRDGRIRASRVDIWYFGSGGPGNDPGTQEREAYALWRQVSPALCPGHGESTRFVAANCLVYGIDDEGDPYPYTDQDTGWRAMIGPVVLRWSEVPVS